MIQKYRNGPRKQEVVVKNKVASFYGSQCILVHCKIDVWFVLIVYIFIECTSETLCDNRTVYTSVTHDSKGIIGFNTTKRPGMYRKYEAYIIGFEPNASIQVDFDDGPTWCHPLIIEVRKVIKFHLADI